MDNQRRVFQFGARVEEGTRNQIVGLGVPYDTVIEHAGVRERFAEGSVDSTGAILCYEHREPIGAITSAASVARGVEIKASISDTAQGRDVVTLIGDGVVQGLSIGFKPQEWHYETDDQGDVLVWDKVQAYEYSVCAFPAYPTAGIGRTGERKEIMSETTADAKLLEGVGVTRAEYEALSDRVRQLATAPAESSATGQQWRTYGEYVKAVARGDSDAIDQYRAYTGATTSDTVNVPSAVRTFIALVGSRRRIIPEVTNKVLPESGMTVDYAEVQTETIRVAQQAQQGDNLTGGKISLKSSAAPIKTYGGYTELSLQLVERASVQVLDVALLAMGLRYAAATDSVVAAELKRLETANAAKGVVVADTATAADWLGGLVDMAVGFEDSGLSLGLIVANAAMFKRLLTLKDGNNRLMTLQSSPDYRVGNVSATKLVGDIAGVKVVYHPGVARAVAMDPAAVEWHESPNAPARLTDETIINLARQYSVYGYGAVTPVFTSGVVPIKAA